jgi:hypothetical protein
MALAQAFQIHMNYNLLLEDTRHLEHRIAKS